VRWLQGRGVVGPGRGADGTEQAPLSGVGAVVRVTREGESRHDAAVGAAREQARPSAPLLHRNDATRTRGRQRDISTLRPNHRTSNPEIRRSKATDLTGRATQTQHVIPALPSNPCEEGVSRHCPRTGQRKLGFGNSGLQEDAQHATPP
jgi:hypothetical protein